MTFFSVALAFLAHISFISCHLALELERVVVFTCTKNAFVAFRLVKIGCVVSFMFLRLRLGIPQLGTSEVSSHSMQACCLR